MGASRCPGGKRTYNPIFGVYIDAYYKNNLNSIPNRIEDTRWVSHPTTVHVGFDISLFTIHRLVTTSKSTTA